VTKNIWPKVSVIIPAYNAEDTIESCLRSLTRQRYLGEFEVILVNNRSTDNTLELAKKQNVKVIDAFCSQGSYYARNVGLACSNSEIVAFTDSDCVADKNWIHYLVQHLTQNSQVGAVGGEIRHLERNAMEAIFGSTLGIKHIKDENPYLVTANVAYKMKVIKEVGPFDSTFLSGGDVDISWRIFKKGYQIAVEPKAVIYHFPRKTPWSFFVQIYKNGLGWAKTRRKHQIEDSQALELSLLLKSELKMLGVFSIGVIKCMLLRKNRNSISIMIPVFSAILNFAVIVGIIRGYKTVYSKEKERSLKD